MLRKLVVSTCISWVRFEQFELERGEQEQLAYLRKKGELAIAQESKKICLSIVKALVSNLNRVCI